jgi:hypothetical protein
MTGHRGAQPGNTNALKHGFYSVKFRTGEVNDLDAFVPDLNGEVALLRVMLRRMFEAASADKEINLDTWAKIMGSAGATCTRIATLVRTQQILAGKAGDVNAVLSAALADVIRNWRS